MSEIVLQVIDFETSDEEPPVGEVVEVGSCIVRRAEHGGEWVVELPTAQFAKPKGMMSAVSRGVHHISMAELAGKPAPEQVLKEMIRLDVAAHVAHYREFESQFIGLHPWICTWRCAQRIWPGFRSYKNQSLRYELDLELDPAIAMPPHRAGPDCYVTGHILVEMLRETSIEQLIQWTGEPLLFAGPIGFGKHKGIEWKDLPPDYLRWMANEPDMSPDNKFTASHYLKVNAMRDRRNGNDPFAQR